LCPSDFYEWLGKPWRTGNGQWLGASRHQLDNLKMSQANTTAAAALQPVVDPSRDHVRGGTAANAITIVLYGDYLCPYCRRLRSVVKRLQEAFGERLAYVYRHFPNERAHPGAEFFARVAEAAGNQGRFWEMHDWLYEHEPPLRANVWGDLVNWFQYMMVNNARYEIYVDAMRRFQRLATVA
jgi:hypothetical protein